VKPPTHDVVLMLLLLISMSSFQFLAARGLLEYSLMTSVIDARLLIAVLGWVFLIALVAWSIRREPVRAARLCRRHARASYRGPLRQEAQWPPAPSRRSF
jgi:hypothetical protein